MSSLVFLGAGFYAIAQGPAAKVLAVQGDVKLQDGMEVRTAVPGMSISADESLVLSDASYVSFVNSDGKTGEVRGRGQFDMESFMENESEKNNVKTLMYADYVVSRMTPEGKKNRLGATGHYVKTRMRGEETLRLHIPSAGKIYQSSPLISWESDGSKEYTIEVRNMFQELLFEVKSSTNYFRMDLNDEKNKDESTFLIRVKSSQRVSEFYALKRLNPEKADALTAELSEMKQLGDGPADKFLKAGIFEYHHLLADALTCYLEAMQEAPDVVAYREAYEEFLLRNHLIRF